MGAIEPQSFYNWSLISSAIRACGAGNDAFVAAADGEAEDNENAVVLPPSSTDPLHVQQQLAALQQEPAGHHCYIWGAVDWTVQGSTARDRSHLKLSRPTYLPLHKPMTIVDVSPLCQKEENVYWTATHIHIQREREGKGLREEKRESKAAESTQSQESSG